MSDEIRNEGGINEDNPLVNYSPDFIKPGDTKEFIINFSLTYAPFLKARNLTDISDNQIKQMVGSTINFYENQASIKDIRDFFEIPDSYDAYLLSRNYSIVADVVGKDTAHQCLFVKYTMTIGSKIIV